MACNDVVCGTGGWSGPLPGDPDNNLTLSANMVYGGIKVSWTYPHTNAYAVAHTKLYRNRSNNFSQAVELAIVAGNTHLDSLNPTTSTEYFYWIRVVSINGTVGDLIGPVSAIAEHRGVQTLEDLTGLIDAGVLAQSLKTEIAKITQNSTELNNEIAKRLLNNAALSELLAQVQAGLEESMAFVYEEVQTRKDGDSALVSSLNTVAAINAQNAAAILEERTARVTKEDSLATSIAQVLAATNETAAAVRTEVVARTDNAAALAQQISTVQTSLDVSVSSVQTTMQSQINSVTGELDAIYTAKVDVNGLIGGFGIYGTTTSVEAGFDVDRFWVGRTTNKVKPFVIEGDTVYLAKARIKDADIDTLKISGQAVTIPVGQVISDTATITLTNTFTVTGLATGEQVPVFIHCGVVAPEGCNFRVYLNSTIMSEDHPINMRGVYVGSTGLVGNGAHTVTLSFVTAPTAGAARRLSLLTQVCKR